MENNQEEALKYEPTSSSLDVGIKSGVVAYYADYKHEELAKKIRDIPYPKDVDTWTIHVSDTNTLSKSKPFIKSAPPKSKVMKNEKKDNERFVFEVVSLIKDSRCKKYFELAQERNSRNSLVAVGTVGDFIDTAASWGVMDELFPERLMEILFVQFKKYELTKANLDELADKFEEMVDDKDHFDQTCDIMVEEIYRGL